MIPEAGLLWAVNLATPAIVFLLGFVRWWAAIALPPLALPAVGSAVTELAMSELTPAIRLEAGAAYLWQVWVSAGLGVALSVLAAGRHARRRGGA